MGEFMAFIRKIKVKATQAVAGIDRLGCHWVVELRIHIAIVLASIAISAGAYYLHARDFVIAAPPGRIISLPDISDPLYDEMQALAFVSRTVGSFWTSYVSEQNAFDAPLGFTQDAANDLKAIFKTHHAYPLDGAKRATIKMLAAPTRLQIQQEKGAPFRWAFDIFAQIAISELDNNTTSYSPPFHMRVLVERTHTAQRGYLLKIARIVLARTDS
ncbi:MAG: hypothetical protein D6712_18820 [Chloroflexi bacterium]|nr:MAG: hypothetical protein D6712_18820 [Chloroflexota bacterium]